MNWPSAMAPRLLTSARAPWWSSPLRNPLSLKTLRVSRLLTESAIISVAALKTHPWTGVTFSMKNMFGAIYEQEKAVLHAGLDKNIVDITKVLKPPLPGGRNLCGQAGRIQIRVWVGYPPEKMDLVVAGYDPVCNGYGMYQHP